MSKGNFFTIFTDHRSLTKVLMHNHDNYSPHKIRQLEPVSQFADNIRHIDVKENYAVGVLSPQIVICCPVIANQQNLDKLL